ncbi:sigma-70 family RNA polymerase sigma factor [Fulvivirga kasyanovii]|uniref:RNA polymerase sigma factor 70 region 4 type 2 domain-containing protein n=1 Tax=Fulvivirga kasyanovii TaxID=396812 RepID=A0ABW9RX57_9BACT|nr:sigma factor-like helix-turn-helix DNA-binding protein [Fulvivirga kasyanovii]MTI28808.1 hypothetical protein [Fulvivirga kasyanovii]
MADHKITSILKGCFKNDRKSQKELYRQFHGFAMGICYRYTNSREACMDLVNRSFLKLFQSMYQANGNFREHSVILLKVQFKSILISTCIDYYHNIKATGNNQRNVIGEPLDKPIEAIRELSPIYRMVFNLFVIEGYGHRKISGMLGISIRDSEICLSEARRYLKEQLKAINRLRHN